MPTRTKFAVALFLAMTIVVISVGILSVAFLGFTIEQAVIGAFLVHWFCTGALSLFGIIDWSVDSKSSHEKPATKEMFKFCFVGILLGWLTAVCLIAVAIVNDPEVDEFI